jgi:AraC family transcriptional regulator
MVGSRGEYTARINRVLDHVHENLDGDLSLRALARVARFSPHHFHRIFSALVGETCHQFVRRVRLERAAQKPDSYNRPTHLPVPRHCGCLIHRVR